MEWRQRKQKINKEIYRKYHAPVMKKKLTTAQKQNKNCKNMIPSPCLPTQTLT